MTATSAHQRAVCDYIASLGTKIKLFNGDPLGAGAAIASTPAIVTVTWGASVDGTGPDANKAVATSSTGNMTLPASSNATHYGVYAPDGTTLLRGHALDTGITVSASGPVSVDVVVKTRYQGGL